MVTAAQQVSVLHRLRKVGRARGVASARSDVARTTFSMLLFHPVPSGAMHRSQTVMNDSVEPHESTEYKATEYKATEYKVAVRELCEFAAKSGDLDLRFTPSPTAQQGIAGHQTVASRRGNGYRSEVSLSGQFEELTVRGRADGYDTRRRVLEEIKTYRGELERMPANHRALHWAQAKVYAWLICDQEELSELAVSLVYFEIRTQRETALQQRCSAAELRSFFEALAGRFLIWARDQVAHRQRRDAALRNLRFPHTRFRAGQRPLAAAVFTAARRGRCLLAQAPTGLGKTIATLFPLLKACPEQALDKIFFLSAKGSGRALALAAVETLRAHEPGFAAARDRVDRTRHSVRAPRQSLPRRTPARSHVVSTIGCPPHETPHSRPMDSHALPFAPSHAITRCVRIT